MRADRDAPATADQEDAFARRPPTLRASITGSAASCEGTARVGVVILNWQRPRDVVQCVRSLAAVQYDALEIVVIDNSASDEAVAFIRDSIPTVPVIENGRNLGFAGGCNVGIRHFLSVGVDYVLLLNDDAYVAPDTVQRLVDVAESDVSIGMAGPMIYYAGTRRIWSAGGEIDCRGVPRHLRLNELDERSEQPDIGTRAEDVGYVTGCVLLVRRAVLEQVGLLDERFFAYFEEAEWCARARAHGFRVVVGVDAVAWHNIDQPDRERSPLYLYLMTRNRLLYLRCINASNLVVTSAVIDVLRTAVSWMVKPRHRRMRPLVGTILVAALDFALGRFGRPSRWRFGRVPSAG